MPKTAIDLMVEFDKKHPEAGHDPLLKELLKQYKKEILTCPVCRKREIIGVCAFCQEFQYDEK